MRTCLLMIRHKGKLNIKNKIFQETINKLQEEKKDYSAVHQWVRRHLPEPDLCEICHNKPPYDLANLTDIYNRDFKNWKYLCRSCHEKLDFDRGIRKPTRLVGERNGMYGKKSHWYGKHLSAETKFKIRLARLGKKASPETKLKISRNHADVSGKKKLLVW